MLSVDHAFCEKLYLCDFNRESMIEPLSDRAAYRVRDFGNPVKIQGRTQKYHVPAPPKRVLFIYIDLRHMHIQ